MQISWPSVLAEYQMLIALDSVARLVILAMVARNNDAKAKAVGITVYLVLSPRGLRETNFN